MDVLIKGMELPKNCAVCPLETDVFGAALCQVPHDGQIGRRIYEGELPPVGSEERRPYWCPLIEVPSAERRGKWIKDSDTAFYWKCSECGAYLLYRKEEYLLRDIDEPNYCPNCGARMEAEKGLNKIIGGKA